MSEALLAELGGIEFEGAITSRIKDMLAEVAPPGAKVTAELRSEVRRRLRDIVADELRKLGMEKVAADNAAGVIAGCVTIEEKKG